MPNTTPAAASSDERRTERPTRFARCPGCGADPQQRIETSGFGNQRHSVCKECGYEFVEERQHGRA